MLEQGAGQVCVRLVLPFWFSKRLFGSEGAPPLRAAHGLELLELLLGVALRLGVVDELVDERALARGAGQVVRAPAAEGRVCRQDLADLRSRRSIYIYIWMEDGGEGRKRGNEDVRRSVWGGP